MKLFDEVVNERLEKLASELTSEFNINIRSSLRKLIKATYPGQVTVFNYIGLGKPGDRRKNIESIVTEAAFNVVRSFDISKVSEAFDELVVGDRLIDTRNNSSYVVIPGNQLVSTGGEVSFYQLQNVDTGAVFVLQKSDMQNTRKFLKRDLGETNETEKEVESSGDQETEETESPSGT